MTVVMTQHRHAKKLKITLLLAVLITVIASVVAFISIATLNNTLQIQRVASQNQAQAEIDLALGSQDGFELPDNTSYIPEPLDEATLVEVIAKNQPAVVRLVTVLCVDISLVSAESSFTIDDACGGGVGTGSIISRDGYIATNGHVVTITPKQALATSLSDNETIQSYLEHIVEAGYITTARANTIIAAINDESPSVESLLSQTIQSIPDTTVQTSDVTTQHAVQLSNEPVRVQSINNRIGIELTDTVVDARLIDQDYDAVTSDQSLATGQFTTSDVAILKAEGDYPYVTLGSITGIGRGDQLTAIGFPAFVDGSLDTDAWQTVPSITQGEVKEVLKDADVNGRNILSTTVPIAQGNSGGPSFNDQGEQIGINTYSDLKCEDLKCFGDGLVRDIDDLKVLLRKNNIILATGGVTDDWHRGLDAFVEGDYPQALAAFEEVKDQYPSNYVVSPLALAAREQVGGANDSSTTLQTRTVTIAILTAVGIVTLLIIVTLIILIIYLNRRHIRTLRREADSRPPSPNDL